MFNQYHQSEIYNLTYYALLNVTLLLLKLEIPFLAGNV